MLQDLANKKYLTQAEALRYLRDVAIKRPRFERMMREGTIRVKDKENYDVKNSSVRGKIVKAKL
jgi:hypothetical protein